MRVTLNDIIISKVQDVKSERSETYLEHLVDISEVLASESEEYCTCVFHQFCFVFHEYCMLVFYVNEAWCVFCFS